MSESQDRTIESPGRDADPGNRPRIKVEDRRHWARTDRESEESEDPPPASTHPTMLDEYRRRAEQAEARLQEYIEAFKQSREDHEKARLRLERDVDRKVELKFGGVLEDLLAGLDDLELAVAHVQDVPEAKPLADGVRMVLDRFLSTLDRNGVARIDPVGEPFDPHEAEAVRVDSVQRELDGKVTETVRPGYRLGDRVIRAARVAVGKHSA